MSYHKIVVVGNLGRDPASDELQLGGEPQLQEGRREG
jgi:hypothetical protein